MKGLYKATITIVFGVFLLLLHGCGGGQSSLYCSPNFSQGNIAMKVTYVIGSLNSYEFEVCYNDSFQGTQVSVYGVETFADIATITPAVDVRLAHLSDGLFPGDRFTVTFANDDTWFAIYADNSGTLSTTTQLIKGEFR